MWRRALWHAVGSRREIRMATTSVLVEGIVFGEGPRWRDGRLYFSDMHADRVVAVDPAGRLEAIVDVPGRPSGLGWDAQGRLLIVSMTDRRLLRLEARGLVEVADLSALATGQCNDMVVDAQGRAYIGNFGFDFETGDAPRNADLIRVDPDGRVSVAAKDLQFPNGSVITPDGRTLIVAESMGAQLTAFDVARDGGLSGRRLWAKLPEGVLPDGICLDAENAIWVASPTSREVARVAEGGRVLERIPLERMAIACMLGGADRRTLFILTSTSVQRAECQASRAGRVETARVAVPGAGLP
jgi:YD repeat-containing protein